MSVCSVIYIHKHFINVEPTVSLNKKLFNYPRCFGLNFKGWQNWKLNLTKMTGASRPMVRTNFFDTD